MRTLLEVIKTYHKFCSTILLIRENRFNPLTSCHLATLRFEILWHQKRMTWQNFLQNTERNFNNRTLCCLFCKKLRICKSFCRIISAMFDFCKKFCKVILFWCHKISKCRIANGTKSNGLHLFSRIRRISLGHLFITSSGSHFFNKTDLERYLFKIQCDLQFRYFFSQLERTLK